MTSSMFSKIKNTLFSAIKSLRENSLSKLSVPSFDVKVIFKESSDTFVILISKLKSSI